ncbi:serine/threonine protein kinase [Polyangium jinanense]|uniref:Protein kinase n=1 Tax=Polyangium jinanense TaxID=2829994 RepID=A0A9X3X324_9BACT|nr:serine/threonine protein kinase [Polyangium jinanense]MDC3958346.1 protein kinase [Polyangium jinanense]MDC3983319.1 protein kinase [Polyangium jinanense]
MSESQDVPERLGRYEIVERLASGGMGEVFIARFVAPGGFVKPVAVKRIHPHLAEDETFIHMLHDEANVAAAIRHPNIISTIDVGFEAGNHFVVLDYANGDPLQRMLRDIRKNHSAAFPDWMVAWIGAEVASALHAAHEAKNLEGESLEIIHRDVSTSNVILSDAGHPMLFDFGVAKAKQRMVQTSHGELKGKLPYMAPETFRGEAVDRTVDVFSLGVMLYELCTGNSPFARNSDLETIMALQSAVVEPPSRVRDAIHDSLDPIVMRTMARDRAERYPTALAVENDLRAWARARGAPHDAASAAAWIAETFPERCAFRKALLARVASNAPRSQMISSPRINTLTPGAFTPPSRPPGQLQTPTPGLVSHTPAPLSGMTPAPSSYVPFGPEPSVTSSSSIPGVAPSDPHALGQEFPPPRSSASRMPVFLGVLVTLVLGCVAFFVLGARGGDDTTAAAAPPSAVSPVPEPSAIPAALTAPSSSAAQEPLAASAKPSAKPGATAPKAGGAPPPLKKGGPLVRSYD